MYCQKCQDHHGAAAHCSPFEVCFPDIEEDSWFTIWAQDAEDAAERMAAKRDRDSAEYLIIKQGGGRAQVRPAVADGEDAPIKEFQIEAYAEPTYNANEIEPYKFPIKPEPGDVAAALMKGGA